MAKEDGMTTIVFAHPWHGSFNKAVLDTITERLQQKGKALQVLDLNKDGFDPVMSEKELSVYQRGDALNPLVQKYCKILDETDCLVFVFPLWWYDMPAILRGFFDKVMLEGSAFHADEKGLHPLREINKTILFTTSFCSTKQLVEEFGDPIQGTIMKATFPVLGFHNPVWKNLGGIDASTKEQREEFLQEIAQLF